MPTDRALRHSCSRYIRARGAGPPEAIVGEKLRAAGWLHFHPRQKRNERFTFAMERNMLRGGSAPRPRAHRHISPSNPRTQ